MIRYLLGTRISCVSGRALAKAIAELQGRRCGYYERAPYRMRVFDKTHVRFGSLIPTHGHSLNAESAVRGAADKLAALVRMGNSNVSVPKLYSTELALTDNSLTRIFRKASHHSGSDHPIIVRSGHTAPVEAAQYDYCMQYLIKHREYRVHSFLGHAIRVQQKKHKRGEAYDATIRNLANGWVFCTVPENQWCTLPAGLLELGVAAVSSLYLGFGAADIIQDKHGRLYVLEVNTAPGLTSDNGVAVYANAMVAWDRSL